MTLERILAAAVSAMINGHHAPHCFSAHVIGKGYVNDGSAAFDRADYLRQLQRAAESEVVNMVFAPAYAAQQGYDSDQPRHGVLMANWNHLPRNLDKLLEKAGYAVEWSDEWTICDDCGKALRTSPDSYFWEPAYTMDDSGSCLCRACEEPVIIDARTGEAVEETEA